MTKKDIFNCGYVRGVSIAQVIDLVSDDMYENLENAFVIDENNRQFSPFEYIANDLNELQEKKTYDVWEIFESGVSKGIAYALDQRLK